MIEQIKKLIDVKSLVTLSLTATFIYIIVMQIPVDETFKIIYTTIIGFYFGVQIQKKINEAEKIKNETKVDTLEITGAGVCPVCGHDTHEVTFTKDEVDSMSANTESF